VQGDEAGPSVSDLAERIKALKAANTIEAMPQRARQKQSSAEEPVTARIRRKTEALPASDSAIDPDAAASPIAASQSPETKEQATPGDLSPAIPAENTGTPQDCSFRPELTYQELVGRSRRENEVGPAVTR
jgi:cell pole-organizing protein PopZ